MKASGGTSGARSAGGSPRRPARGRPAGVSRPIAAGLCLATVVLWQVSFAPFDLSFLAYLLLVPWAIAVIAAGRDRTAMVRGWATGLVLMAVGAYWLTWITLVGYVALVLYLSLYWLLSAWAVRRAHQQGIAMWLVLPIVWVALEYARAHVISGFPWFFLAHSQYRFTLLLQVADVTGQYGVSFFVAMVNGLLIDVVVRLVLDRRRRGEDVFRRVWPGLRVGWVVTGMAAAAMVLYGAFRLGQAAKTVSPGPRVGIVQCAFPISLGRRGAGEEKIFHDHLRQSRRLPLAELDLIVWPETVLPTRFDKPWETVDLDRFSEDTQAYAYVRFLQQAQRELAELLASHDLEMIAGAMTSREVDAGRGEKEIGLFNTAMLLETSPSGRLRTVATYDKMHCVPFSEYVPFGEGFPWLHRLLRRFVPAQMPQIVPGRRVRRFQFGRGKRQWTAAAPICYEGTFARVCRQLCYGRPRGGKEGFFVRLARWLGYNPAAQKRVDCLINISNDGWFIAQLPKRTWASTELDQHLSGYVFRAIENRTPVVRAVNTGISGFIDSSGRILELVTHEQTGMTKMVTGVADRQVLVDNRRSVYSSVGDAAAHLCCVAAVALGFVLWLRNRRRTSKE